MPDLALNTCTHKVLCQPSRGPHCLQRDPRGHYKGRLHHRTQITASRWDPNRMNTTNQNTTIQNTRNQKTKDQNTAEKEMLAAFQRDKRTLRSPVETLHPTGSRRILRSPVLLELEASPAVATTVTLERRTDADEAAPVPINAAVSNQVTQVGYSDYSPRQEQIERMRSLEEDCLMKCRNILQKMKQAFDKQKNISKDVKDGVSQLDEQLDVISSYRKIWKEAEKTRRMAATERRTAAQNKRIHETGEKETPVTTRSKRMASSPIAPVTSKKAKENDRGKWQTVKAKRKGRNERTTAPPAPNKDSGEGRKSGKRKRRARMKRPAAVLIKPTTGKSYADMLRDIKGTVGNLHQADGTEISVRSVRKTQSGSVLLEVAGGGEGKLCEVIKAALKDTADVSNLKRKTTIEIRDLDALTEAEEVAIAIRRLLGREEEELNVRLTNSNSREQRRAFVTMAAEVATTVLRAERLKVGWISCRVRKMADVQRCFRCFGAGHTQRTCNGPDRKGEGLCIRCGIAGHKIRECVSQPRCCICIAEGKGSVDHLPGSSRCPTHHRSRQ